MAKAIKLGLVRNEGGRLYVPYAFGDPPLGNVNSETSFSGEQELIYRISQVEDLLGENGLLYLALAINLLNQNGTLKQFTSANGKTTTLDVFAANPLRIT